MGFVLLNPRGPTVWSARKAKVGNAFKSLHGKVLNDDHSALLVIRAGLVSL